MNDDDIFEPMNAYDILHTNYGVKQEFNLTEHLLERHQCDFFYYYITNEPANNNGGDIIEVNFGG